MIQSTIGLVPDGVVVFLPSYAFLDKVKQVWSASGLLAKLGERKHVSHLPNPLSVSSTSAAVLRASDVRRR